MLQRLTFPLDEELGDGLWPVAELERMNAAFVRSVLRAVAAGHESLVAASATVRVGVRLNGSRQLAEEAALGGVWKWFVDVKFDATAVDVMERVRAICPGISVEEVREGFRRRLMETCGARAR